VKNIAREGDHEAAADRVVDAAVQHLAVAVIGGEPHAVRVPLEDPVVMQDHVVGLGEGDLVHGQERDPAILADAAQDRRYGVGVDLLRDLAGKAEQDRLVAAVALADERQRAVERHRQAPDPVEQPVGLQRHDETMGGAHRPDRVRARRADAHLEQIERADRLSRHGARLLPTVAQPRNIRNGCAALCQSRQALPRTAVRRFDNRPKNLSLPRHAGSRHMGESREGRYGDDCG